MGGQDPQHALTRNHLPQSHSPQQQNTTLNLPATSPSFAINLPTTQPPPSSYGAPVGVVHGGEVRGRSRSETGGGSDGEGGDEDGSVNGSPELDGEGGAKPARKKSKRPRQVLSCSMCVRRKTKCDKIHPCTACVKRGDPQGCHIETGDEPPS